MLSVRSKVYLNGNGFDIRTRSQIFPGIYTLNAYRRAPHHDILCLLTTQLLTRPGSFNESFRASRNVIITLLCCSSIDLIPGDRRGDAASGAHVDEVEYLASCRWARGQRESTFFICSRQFGILRLHVRWKVWSSIALKGVEIRRRALTTGVHARVACRSGVYVLGSGHRHARCG